MNTKRKLESELKELINKKAKGAQIRSRLNGSMKVKQIQFF